MELEIRLRRQSTYKDINIKKSSEAIPNLTERNNNCSMNLNNEKLLDSAKRLFTKRLNASKSKSRYGLKEGKKTMNHKRSNFSIAGQMTISNIKGKLPSKELTRNKGLDGKLGDSPINKSALSYRKENNVRFVYSRIGKTIYQPCIKSGGNNKSAY